MSVYGPRWCQDGGKNRAVEERAESTLYLWWQMSAGDKFVTEKRTTNLVKLARTEIYLE